MRTDFLKKKVFWHTVWILCTVFWCAFIFSNSLKPAEESGKQSRGVSQVIEETVRKVKPDFELPQKLVRKSAHFIEYFIYGILLSLSRFFRPKKNSDFITGVFLAGLITALFDETLQLFSYGRASAVVDVWIDFSAIIVSCLLFCVFYHFIRRRKRFNKA